MRLFSLLSFVAYLAVCTGFAPQPSCQRRSVCAHLGATIEAERLSAGPRPAVLDRPKPTPEDPVKERGEMGHESWELRLYNDGKNTREHVARSLVKVIGMSEMNAYQTMMTAHQTGMAKVGRWIYEVAEMYHEALKIKGIVCDLAPVEE